MKNLVCIMVLMMGFLICQEVHSADKYVDRGLLYFWDFENGGDFISDVKVNAQAFIQGKVRWIPPDFSFHDSGVIHIHGDKTIGSHFLIPSSKFSRDLTDWTIDFEFGAGTHDVDHEDHGADTGQLVDGNVFEWGELKVSFSRDPEGARWQGVIVVEYRGKKKIIEDVRGFDFNYMAIRSEDEGISIWLNSYCTDLLKRPRSSVIGKEMKFGGSGFAGRFDDIKIYDVRLRPWEITQNFLGHEFNVEPKGKLVTTWGKIKNEVDN